MAIVVPREGWRTIAGILLTRTMDPEPIVLRLFRNPITKTREARTRDFAEATFRGYVPVSLAPTGWILGLRGATHREHLFRCTADPNEPQAIYGYYMVGDHTHRLWWFERFPDGPYPIQRADDEVAVTPTLAWRTLRRSPR